MRQRLCALLCALVLLLSACVAKVESPPEGAYKVYFAVSGSEGAERTVDYEYRVPKAGDDVLEGLVDILLAGPETAGLASPLPASGVLLRSVELDGDGMLRLDLSEQYNGLPGVYLTVANACFVLTLSQVAGVESLYITVEGEPLPYQTIQPLRSNDLRLTGAEEETVTFNAVLYFLRSEGDALTAEYRDVVKTEEASLPAAVLDALLEGSRQEGVKSAIPAGVSLRSVKLESGICKVDLSAEFLDKAPTSEQEARLALYAVINTLCAMDEVRVESVLLTVEGQQISQYGGVPTLSPLEPNFNLAK